VWWCTSTTTTATTNKAATAINTAGVKVDKTSSDSPSIIDYGELLYIFHSIFGTIV